MRYSHSKKGGLCVACVLFAPECVGFGRHQNLGILVKTPMTKYKKAIEILKNHDTLDYHKTAMAKMSGFVMTRENPQQSIANLLDLQRKEEIEKNRRLLVPIVQTLVFCGRNVLPLRGHRDDGKIDEAEYIAGEGIFRGLLRFHRQTGDKNLEELLEKPNAKLISKTTQNEILFNVGAKIQENVVVKIKESNPRRQLQRASNRHNSVR